MTVHHPHPSAGFTLVEMLVSLALLGFLTVLLFGGLHFGSRVWERSQVSYRDQRALRSTVQVLTNELSQAYPLADAHGVIAFQGLHHELTWLSAKPLRDGGMTRLHLFRATDGDRIDLSRWSELSGGAQTETAYLLRTDGNLDLQYYGRRRDERDARWGDDWRDQPWLPSLVRIVVSDATAAQPTLDLAIAPRLGGDASCVLDVFTNTCQGA